MTIPYTYLVHCIPTGEVYYGARWAEGCSPNDLQRIGLFGKTKFEVEIRRTFLTGVAARQWEDKVLRRMQVINNPLWLNKSYGLVYDVRGTIKGKRMVYLILENRYVYMDDNLASAAESMGIGMIGGPQKPPDHGKKISDSLKGIHSTCCQYQAIIYQ
jgi:hypothetical protein